MATIDFDQVFARSPNPYMVLDREFRYVAANRAYLELVNRPLDQLLGRALFDVFPHDPSDPDNESARKLRASFERVLASGLPDMLALIRYRVPRGIEGEDARADRFWSATHVPLHDRDGRVAFILQHTVDVTELQELKAIAARAQDAGGEDRAAAGVLRRAQRVQEANWSLTAERAFLRSLFEQAPGFIAFLRGPEHVFELINAAYGQLIGHRPVNGLRLADALPEARDQGFVALLDDVFRTGVPYVGRNVPVQVRQPDGGLRDFRLDFVYQPIFEADGTISGIFVQGNDITEQQRAQEELARYRAHLEELVAERTQALQDREAELRQAQKMEALGKLTGGVAHDFNNLLQIIGGNLQLLSREAGTGGDVRRRLATSLAAVDRGAKLSAALLAFARRQPLAPRVLELSRLVQDLEPLLQRALGEEIELELQLIERDARTFVDRNQLENVLLNLTINARDAMEEGGRLVIAVEPVASEAPLAALPAGPYVQVRLEDSGHGMAPEVLERAIEPFFTTKPEGRGTGLGLSMAYGFARQSGGTLELTSEPGRGTSVRLILPRTDAPVAQPSTPPPLESGAPSGSEVVLVVEDEPSVRATVLEMLRTLGYTALEASDPRQALQLLERTARVDVLFTDVVMPGPLRAPELARQARALHPGLRVLFTSGYPRDEIASGGRLEPDVMLLKKPYREEELGAMLREILAQVPADAAAPRPQPGAPLRVLVVEDDEDIREGTLSLLEELGHVASGVETAAAARALIGSLEVDLLVTDVGLPDGSGVELARAFLERRPGLPVVLATGWSDPRQVGGLEGLDHVTVLTKPYSLEQLRRAVEAVARRR